MDEKCTSRVTNVSLYCLSIAAIHKSALFIYVDPSTFFARLKKFGRFVFRKHPSEPEQSVARNVLWGDAPKGSEHNRELAAASARVTGPVPSRFPLGPLHRPFNRLFSSSCSSSCTSFRSRRGKGHSARLFHRNCGSASVCHRPACRRWPTAADRRCRWPWATNRAVLQPPGPCRADKIFVELLPCGKIRSGAAAAHTSPTSCSKVFMPSRLYSTLGSTWA